jgi:hypothetical protein
MDLCVIQLILGHSTYAVTEKFYAGVFQENLSDAVKVLKRAAHTGAHFSECAGATATLIHQTYWR